MLMVASPFLVQGLIKTEAELSAPEPLPVILQNAVETVPTPLRMMPLLQSV
jgi:hypothetical protein